MPSMFCSRELISTIITLNWAFSHTSIRGSLHWIIYGMPSWIHQLLAVHHCLRSSEEQFFLLSLKCALFLCVRSHSLPFKALCYIQGLLNSYHRNRPKCKPLTPLLKFGNKLKKLNGSNLCHIIFKNYSRWEDFCECHTFWSVHLVSLGK